MKTTKNNLKIFPSQPASIPPQSRSRKGRRLPPHIIRENAIRAANPHNTPRFRCPDCQELFILSYGVFTNKGFMTDDTYRCRDCAAQPGVHKVVTR